MRSAKITRTLTLNRETLRLLTDSNLRDAFGGITTTVLTVCPMDGTTTCCTQHIGCGGNTGPGN
jgi:hypothetical protein